MGKPTGFLEFERRGFCEREPAERVRDTKDVYARRSVEELREQGARCMNCGVPFCHHSCPLGNVIPDWNDLVYRDRWQHAIVRLHATNNFPEVTGLVCPAPCESGCVLGINAPAVTIKQIELAIIERAFDEGWVRPEPPAAESGKRVGIVGSGPAGLAAAQQLRRAGHAVTVYERDDRIGGLMRYGIPEFKLEKRLLERRLGQMTAEGVEFRTGVEVGRDLSAEELRATHDAVLLAGGSTRPRDLAIPGRDLGGIHFAMPFLTQQTRITSGDTIPSSERIDARGRRVVVIGGGDTGADCVATSHRQGAASVVQLEILDRPPSERTPDNPWPEWARVYRRSYGIAEGGEQRFAISTKRFEGSGRVEQLRCVDVAWHTDNGRPRPQELDGSERAIGADLVLLAMGFVGCETTLTSQLGVELEERGNVRTNERLMTNVEGVFAAGDMQRGQSLVVWAIADGRRAAEHIDSYLRGV